MTIGEFFEALDRTVPAQFEYRLIRPADGTRAYPEPGYEIVLFHPEGNPELLRYVQFFIGRIAIENVSASVVENIVAEQLYKLRAAF